MAHELVIPPAVKSHLGGKEEPTFFSAGTQGLKDTESWDFIFITFAKAQMGGINNSLSISWAKFKWQKIIVGGLEIKLVFIDSAV